MPKLSEIELPPISLQREEIGKRIARLRKEKGLTQMDLADLIGVKRTVIADYERGKTRIYAEMAARIALVLNTTADEIIGFKSKVDTSKQPHLRIIKRLQEIEELSQTSQKSILRSLDMMIDSAKRKTS